MAFPSKDRTQRDGQFLQPYAPADFAQGDVHVDRSDNGGFLFRVDPRPGAGPVIMVQSARRPDWDYAFQNADYLLAAEPQVQTFEPAVRAGERLRFRLQANPTRRASKNSKHSSGEALHQWSNDKGKGKRIPVPPDGLQDWLSRRGGQSGFEVVELGQIVPGYVYFSKTGKRGGSQRLLSVVFEGALVVTDPEAFLKTIQTGIGPAKAFGFGLLSVAPV